MLKKIINLIKKDSTSVSGGFMHAINPAFTDMPKDIINHDIVNSCIRKIANEISKLQPKHVRTDLENGIESLVGSSTNNLNTLFRDGPNAYQTTPEFLEKLIWQRELTGNVFIYPMFNFTSNGRRTESLHIINPLKVEFIEENGTIYINLTFKNMEKVTVKYNEIIHIKKDYSLSDFMGGDANGNPFSNNLLLTLKSIQTAVESVGIALINSLKIRGVVNGMSIGNKDIVKKTREEFENAMQENKSGILFLGLDQNYQQIHVNERVIAPSTLQVLEQRVMAYFGVSQAILNGDFTEAQYQSFYDSTLAPIQNHLSKSFTKILFTENELAHGNKINFYSQKLAFSNTRTKLGVVQALAPLGVLTNNQILEIFGYAPFDGGDVRLASLNFVNKENMDKYQGMQGTGNNLPAEDDKGGEEENDDEE